MDGKRSMGSGGKVRTRAMEATGMGRTKRFGAWYLVLLALALAAVPTVPAGATHVAPPASPKAGSGDLEGRESVQVEGQVPGRACFATTRSVYALRGAGTFHGRTAAGEVVYRAQLDEGQTLFRDGPLQVEIENTEPYFHGFGGTFGSDGTCTQFGAPVPAEFRIFAAEETQDLDGDGDVDLLGGQAWVYRLNESNQKVPCIGQGSFARKGFADEGPNWHADWSLSEDCTVVGTEAGASGEGVAPALTAFTHFGSHGAFSSAFNMKFDYNQHLPAKGLGVSVGGPRSAFLGDVVTVTAGITSDGAPLAGAAVTFSVDGPAPAEPPGGASATGVNGQASFSFTAATEGDYVVTASATSANYPGEVKSATHTVRFSDRRPTMTLFRHGTPVEERTDVTTSQTEENVAMLARVTQSGVKVGVIPIEPVPGVVVNFAVSGPGRATPAEGTAVTDDNGLARFNFTGDRAGDYTVTASATHLGQEITATHTVHLEVNTLKQVGALDLPVDERDLASAVMDPAGNFAYFATQTRPSRVVKVDLDTFQRVGALTLPADEIATSAVMDPAGNYAYFGTGTKPGKVVKVDLNTFQRVGAITLDSGEGGLGSALIDPAGNFAYFATNTTPGRVVKVDLDTFQRVGAITLDSGELITSAVMDRAGDFAYFGAGTFPGRVVVKVDLNTFQRVGAIDSGESSSLNPAVMDPGGNFAYFGARTSSQNKVVKVDLTLILHSGGTLPAD
jgi:hypothetical protein